MSQRHQSLCPVDFGFSAACAQITAHYLVPLHIGTSSKTAMKNVCVLLHVCGLTVLSVSACVTWPLVW